MKPPILWNRLESIKSVIGVDAIDTSSASYVAGIYSNCLSRPSAITNSFHFESVPFAAYTGTFSWWVKLNGWSVANGQPSDSTPHYMIAYHTAQPYIQFGFYPGGGLGFVFDINGTGRLEQYTSDTDIDIPADTWTNLCVTYTHGEQILYINGNNVWSAAGSMNTIDVSLAKIEIGSFGDGANFEFNGWLDNIMYFNYVLNQNEIKKVMNSERGCMNDQVVVV